MTQLNVSQLVDVDVMGVMHIASSNDKTPFDDETLPAFQSKHPSFPIDIEFPEPPDNSSEVLSMSCAMVARAIHGYKAGSADGSGSFVSLEFLKS